MNTETSADGGWFRRRRASRLSTRRILKGASKRVPAGSGVFGGDGDRGNSLSRGFFFSNQVIYTLHTQYIYYSCVKTIYEITPFKSTFHNHTYNYL